MTNQKGFVPILIVILIALGIGGYLIYTNYSNNRTETAQPSLISSPSSTQASKTIDEPEFKPLNYDLSNKKFNGLINYPREIISLNSSAENMSCTSRSEISKVNFTAPLLLKILDDVMSKEPPSDLTSPSYITICDTQQIYIVIYEYQGGGGGSKDIAYLASIQKNPYLFTDITSFLPDAPYFSCQTVYGLKNNQFYLGCGGGDSYNYSISLFKIDLINKAKTNLLNCTNEFPGDNHFQSVCRDQNNNVIYKEEPRLML